MSHDWKGVRVRISVENIEDATLLRCKDVYLDTNTMEDMFMLFDPKLHRFEITPLRNHTT